MPRAKTATATVKMSKKPKPPKPPKPVAPDPADNGQEEPMSARMASGPNGISKADLKRATTLFRQVADPTRLSILIHLATGDRNVTEICGFVSQSQPAVSHHLALLRFGGLVDPTRTGKHNYYSLTPLGRMLVEATRKMVG